MSLSKVYSVPELLGGRIKPTDERFGLWLLSENLYQDNMVTDIGNIIYTEDEVLMSASNVEPGTAITEPFCDNIMLLKVCDLVGCVDSSGKDKLFLKKEICGSFNSYLRGIFSKYITAGHGVKAKPPFLLKSETGQTLAKRLNIDTERYQNPVLVPYKVELSDVDLDVLLCELPELLRSLRMEDYYLMDLDITQDFAGIFNKVEMCDHLINNHNFCYRGEYKENCNVIMDNDNMVGKDCLSWLSSNTRAKVYNKFICQVTSPGVNKQLGNHILNFLKCPDVRLRNTFASDLAKKHGITRMEITIYNGGSQHEPLVDCLTVLETCKTYLQNAPLYSVPISKMWSKLTQSLQNSCCVVFNRLLQYVYWGNGHTRKLTGVQIKLPENQQQRAKMINYVLSAFSFNYLPVNYVEIVEEDVKEKVKIEHKCYIKAGETYFTQSRTLFSIIPMEIDIASMGLVSTDNLVPQVKRKRTNITNKLSPYPLKEITPPRVLSVLSVKKRKLEIEEMEAKRRKLEYLEQNRTIREEYKTLLEKETLIKETKERTLTYFRQSPWKELSTNGVYSISAFAISERKDYPLVGVLAESKGVKDVYFFRGTYKSRFVDAYNHLDELIEDGFVVYKSSETTTIVYSPTEEPFLRFRTNGVTSINRHTFAKVVEFLLLRDSWRKFGDSTYTQEDIECIESIKMQTIHGSVKLPQCKRLEEFPEGTELVVRGIKPVEYRGKTRYILDLENMDTVYLSNYWMEKEIKESNIDLNYKLKLKIDQIKTTPNKHKEVVVFCS